MSYEDSIRMAAILSYPEEMVGYVKSGKFTQLLNISPTPNKNYKLSVKDKIFVLSHGVEYLVHSHPSNNNQPSKQDLLSQQSCGIPFLIVGTNGVTTTEFTEVS